MPTSSYKLFASVATSTDAAASLDIQEDGVITGMLLDILATGADALNDGGDMEVSFGSTSGFAANDTKGSIAGLIARQGFLTSGGSMVGKTAVVGGLNIQVNAGERIYLHIAINAAPTSVLARAWMWIESTSAARPLPRRR